MTIKVLADLRHDGLGTKVKTYSAAKHDHTKKHPGVPH